MPRYEFLIFVLNFLSMWVYFRNLPKNLKIIYFLKIIQRSQGNVKKYNIDFLCSLAAYRKQINCYRELFPEWRPEN